MRCGVNAILYYYYTSQCIFNVYFYSFVHTNGRCFLYGTGVGVEQQTRAADRIQLSNSPNLIAWHQKSKAFHGPEYFQKNFLDIDVWPTIWHTFSLKSVETKGYFMPFLIWKYLHANVGRDLLLATPDNWFNFRPLFQASETMYRQYWL